MDTTQSRKDIGFPEDRADWNRTPAVFDDHTLKISGHPVMEDWEDGYMKRLAQIASMQGGRVLELGFGMGISAGYIQESKKLKDHIVVECHPDVIKNAVDMYPEQIASGKMHLMSGFWEDITPLLKDGSFDGILFDTYPLTEQEIHGNHFWFFEEAYRLLKKGGVLTYYSDEAKRFSENHLLRLKAAGFHDITYEVVDVDPPADCEYWQDKTIVAPIVAK
jgi:guanidinoacetate N-methyltransferase